MRELAEVIWRKIKGRRPAARSSATRPSSTTCQKRVPDVRRPREVLGFECTTSLDEMLDEVIPWVTQAVADGRL